MVAMQKEVRKERLNLSEKIALRRTAFEVSRNVAEFKQGLPKTARVVMP
jgi:hypothetical protein